MIVASAPPRRQAGRYRASVSIDLMRADSSGEEKSHDSRDSRPLAQAKA